MFISFIKSQELYIIPEQWFPTISNVNFCLVKNDIDIHIPLIETVFKNVNTFLMYNDIYPLYFNFSADENANCEYFINLISNTTFYNNTAFCQQTYLCIGGACYNQGCNITMNVCALQTAASFYNVLLHEVLHALGLGHPKHIINNSIMSYITYINNNNSSMYDNIYRLMGDIDIYNINYLMQRDFSSFHITNNKKQIIPIYSPRLHSSGSKNYIINYNNIITPCLIKLNSKPSLNPSLKPSLTPSLKPSLTPSLKPSSMLYSLKLPPKTYSKPSLKPSSMLYSLKPSPKTYSKPSLKPSPKTYSKQSSSKPFTPSSVSKSFLKPSDKLTWFTIENNITPVIDIDTSENAYINMQNNILPDINIKQKPAVFVMANNIIPNIRIG
jgi:hypothetical protein